MILSSLTNMFKRLFRKEEHSDKNYIDGSESSYYRDRPRSVISLEDIPDPIITNPNGRKTILLVNDIPGMLEVFNLELDELELKYNLNVSSEYKIVICTGLYANLVAYKYIKENNIDIAFIDVVATESVTYINNKVIEYNGVNLAEQIKEQYKTSRVGFYTCVPIESTTSSLQKYFNRVKDLIDKNVITEYININKKQSQDQMLNMLMGV